MLTNEEVRRINARVVTELHGSEIVCQRLQISKQQLSQYIGRNPVRRFGDELARRFEREFGYERGWFDHFHPEQNSVLQELIDAAQTSQIDNLRLLLRIALMMRDKQTAEFALLQENGKNNGEDTSAAPKRKQRSRVP